MKTMPRVAVLVESSRAFGRGLIEGIANYSRTHGPWSMYFEPQGLGFAPPAWLSNWKGDGILVRIDDQRMVDAVMATGLPALDLRGRLDTPLPFIGIRNEAVTKLVFEHLRDRGLRAFAFCGIAKGKIRALDWRREHFVRHVEAAGFRCDVYTDDDRKTTKAARTVSSSGKPPQDPLAIDWETEQEALADWVRSLPKPIGIMACHDPRGYQLVDACRRAGVLVPDEVAIVGVDNDPVLCQMADPPLTSVDPDGARIGFTAASWLDRMMCGEPGPSSTVLLEPKGLIARRSSDMLAIDDPEIARAVRYIRDHACEGVRVPDLLAEVAMSRSVLERRFRKVLGRTLKAEMLRVQIDRAKQLLSETDLLLADIAQRTGFTGDKYFSDAFCHQTGLRPTAYRESLRSTERR